MKNQPTLLKKSISYAVLPQIIPRIREFGFNFGYLAYLVAYLFSITRLLPDTHPYLKPENMNRFGVRSVLIEAYHNLTWDRKHLDQIILFGLVSLGFVLILAQLFGIGLFVLSYSGSAVASGVTGYFQTTPPTYDMAFMMLDRVFGVRNFFDSCISQGVPCDPPGPNASTFVSPVIPWPMHDALHALLQFYSEAMLIVGIFIVLYFLFVVVVETAQTGTPFGQRFSTVYAPLRLVMAIMLLLPLAHGINSGQYILLQVAKWGSSLGTNTWKVFNVNLTNGLGLDDANMVIKPNTPDVTNLIQFYHLAHTCRASYEQVYGKQIQPYLINENAVTGVTSFAAAQAFFGNKKDITITYGHMAANLYSKYPARVRPYCGKITLQLDAVNNALAIDIAGVYFGFLNQLWTNTELQAVTDARASRRFDEDNPTPCPPAWGGGCTGVVPTSYISALISSTQVQLDGNITTLLSAGNIGTAIDFTYDTGFLSRGWGAAGLWFNKISNVNGAVVTAMHAKPYGSMFPEVMEHVAKQKLQKAPGAYAFNKYEPSLPKSAKETFTWDEAEDYHIAGQLNEAFQVFRGDNLDPTPSGSDNTNVIGKILATIFGADGLFELRENKDIHPLAQMSGLGKSIIESSIQNIGIGMTLAFGSGLSSGLAQNAEGEDKGAYSMASGLSGAASGPFITIGTIALTTGFLLYYILPFLPFIYFFFAVGKWVKAIFEAMVAVPLWALAHLKIDGDGVPGAAAKNGYILLLDILLRPVLTVFGLIAAVSVFTAMATIMNDMFELVTANLSGHDQGYTPGVYTPGTGAPTMFNIEYYRSGVDGFFFTLLYAVLIYIMATANFKLIDLIPNKILQYMGEGVETFGDKAEDAADNLIRYAAIGGGMLGGQLTGALKDGANVVGQISGGGK